MVGDLVDLSFKKAADEIRVAAGEDDFRAPAFVLHRQHVAADAIADVVVFALDTLAVRHDPLELAQIDHHVVALEAADGAGNDIPRPVLELLVNHFLLRLAEALHHRLFGGLDGDATEVFRCDVKLKGASYFDPGILLLGRAQGHFVELVLMVVIGHNGEGREDSRLTFLRVHLGAEGLDCVGTWNHFPISGNEREFKGGHDLVTVDAFFFFVIFDECDDVVGHGSWTDVWRMMDGR